MREQLSKSELKCNMVHVLDARKSRKEALEPCIEQRERLISLVTLSK